MISLRDGNRLLELGTDKSSVEVGAVDQILQSLETLRDAVIAGELDSQLEAMIAARKPMPKRNVKSKTQ